jgi:hypothetical protein
MDTTRLSIARLLALDVPLDWQEAVAVVQEVAMLSDVHAAMNSRPSLVSPEHCYITRAGSVELPETTDVESPDAVADILRALLAGRDAPEALEDLAYGRNARDMSGELAAFPVGNRRALIAKLATRALSAHSTAATADFDAPAIPAAPPPAAPPPIPAPPVPPATDVSVASAAHDAAAVARETLRPVLVNSAPLRPPFVAGPRTAAEPVAPPFTATPPFVADPPAAKPAAASTSLPPAASVPDLELRRIRKRNAERARGPKSWRQRVGALVTWRPAFPDPRVIGGALIIVAAIGTALWQGGRPDAAPPQRDAAAAPKVTLPTITRPSNASSTGDAVDLQTTLAPATKALASVARSTAAAPAGSGSLPAIPAATGRAAGGEITSPPASTPSAPTPAAEPRTDAAPRDARRDDSAAPAATPAAARAPSAPPPAVVPAPRGAERADAARAIADGGLYSASDGDVSPPVMRRQQLPSNLLTPSADVPDDWPFLELLVDQQGAVEQVRLHARQLAPGQTLYRHRMLLAAAKAWQFEPARRNGEPVRYLMRVPLEP